MSRITIQTAESAAAPAQERLRLAKQANGFLPNLLGVLANAPIALETYQTVTAINAKGSLSDAEREVIQISAASHNGCGFCEAGHARLSLNKLKLPESFVDALRNNEALNDPRLNALARFTRQVLESRGQVSDDEWQAFLAAGYGEEQALELVLGVSLATLCNYANNLARTPINPELQAYAGKTPDKQFA